MPEHVPQRPAPLCRALVRAGRGFSILELVVVLALISVAAAIAVPRYMGSQARYRVTASAARVAADISRAQALARASSAGVEVQFSVAKAIYSVNALAPGGLGGFTTDLSVPPYLSWVDAANFSGTRTLTISGLGVPAPGTLRVRTETLASTLTVGADGSISWTEPAAITRTTRPIAWMDGAGGWDLGAWAAGTATIGGDP